MSNFAFCFVPVAVLGYVLMEKNKERGWRWHYNKHRYITHFKEIIMIGFLRAEYMLKSNINQTAPTISKDIKHQLMISGCSSRAYWISMLIWDWFQCFMHCFVRLPSNISKRRTRRYLLLIGSGQRKPRVLRCRTFLNFQHKLVWQLTPVKLADRVRLPGFVIAGLFLRGFSYFGTLRIPVLLWLLGGV